LGPNAGGGDWIVTVPRVGYRFVGLPGQKQVERTPEDEASAERARRPSIAVLPLANASGEKEQEYLADGITEDITTALTRFRWFFVIARNSSFAYKGKSIDANRSHKNWACSICSREAYGVQASKFVYPFSSWMPHRVNTSGPSTTTSNWPTCLLFKMKSLSAWQVLLSRNYSKLKVCKWRHGTLAI
jgi:hypothetical protein